jgi:RNA polymerase sigma-70 factor (ECF subfamily)
MSREDFASLYDVHYPRVFRYLVWRLRDMDAAEELAAEVFAIALKAFKKGTAPTHVERWLVGIASHLASRPRSERRAEEFAEPEPGAEEDPEELTIGRLESAAIWRSVDSLTQEHRQVLLLRIVAGLSAREVGELMGRTEEAVWRLQLRALKALQRIWKEAAGADTHDAGDKRASG